MADLATVLKLVRDGARLMVGVQSYEAYLAHTRAHHPERTPMTEVEFFDNRMKAQYGEGGKGGFRCC